MSICHDASVQSYADSLKAVVPDIVLAPSMTETESHIDGHKFIFNWCRMRSKELNCIYCCVGAVGTQQLATRTEKNVGGAAVYNGGEIIFEVPHMPESPDFFGPILYVDL